MIAVVIISEWTNKIIVIAFESRSFCHKFSMKYLFVATYFRFARIQIERHIQE